ncbi:putative membrane protein DUF2157 [Murinocardiopsis flavida]|uniref:Putative membrane protein DUF2157 n=1 Tax=Murinocardiopsis flavida TaxID=645275 RepID=A0A2P8DMP9_9ACTN|nr:DUF2157 domain-containing protein [Murinocardiopsis flavida]PSK98491.1 putative membrane protein DUF2157 [Murinocardiopsis flavida]
MTQYGSPTAPHQGGGPRAAALAGLVARGVITAQQADAVHEALDSADREHTGVRWAEIVGYVGGGLVFAGVLALVGVSWEDLGRVGRIGVLSVIAAVLLVGGLAAAGGPKEVRGRSHRVPTARRRITGVLWSLTAVAVMTAVGVAAEDQSWTLPFTVGLLVAAASYAALPSAVGLVACGLLAPATLIAAVDLVEISDGMTTSVLLVALGALWCGIAGTGILVHRRLAYGIGAATALIGAQYFSLEGAFDRAYIAGYIVTFAVAVALLVLYRWDRQVVLLVGGVLGLTTAVPEAVWDLTDGAIGGAAVLLLAGLVLLLTSGIGLRMHRGKEKENGGAERSEGRESGAADTPAAPTGPPAAPGSPADGTAPDPGPGPPAAFGPPPAGGAAPEPGSPPAGGIVPDPGPEKPDADGGPPAAGR